MKLLIAGSRNITDFVLSPFITKDTDTIISGGAKGVDKLAEAYADKHKLSKIILRPKYNIYGKAAPLKRNEELINLADKILIIWDGKSKGTLYTINYAKKTDKEINIIKVTVEK